MGFFHCPMNLGKFHTQNLLLNFAANNLVSNMNYISGCEVGCRKIKRKQMTVHLLLTDGSTDKSLYTDLLGDGCIKNDYTFIVKRLGVLKMTVLTNYCTFIVKSQGQGV